MEDTNAYTKNLKILDSGRNILDTPGQIFKPFNRSFIVSNSPRKTESPFINKNSIEKLALNKSIMKYLKP